MMIEQNSTGEESMQMDKKEQKTLIVVEKALLTAFSIPRCSSFFLIFSSLPVIWARDLPPG